MRERSSSLGKVRAGDIDKYIRWRRGWVGNEKKGRIYMDICICIYFDGVTAHTTFHRYATDHRVQWVGTSPNIILHYDAHWDLPGNKIFWIYDIVILAATVRLNEMRRFIRPFFFLILLRLLFRIDEIAYVSHDHIRYRTNKQRNTQETQDSCGNS